MVMVNVDNSSLQADSQSKSVGLVFRPIGRFTTLVLGRQLLGAVHQLNWVNSRNDLCNDDSTINIVKVIIIISVLLLLLLL